MKNKPVAKRKMMTRYPSSITIEEEVKLSDSEEEYDEGEETVAKEDRIWANKANNDTPQDVE